MTTHGGLWILNIRKINQVTLRHHTFFLVCWLLLSLWAVPISLAQSPEVVFENAKTRQGGQDWTGLYAQYGDELTLGGVARVITEFNFEYYAKFPTDATRTARIRFYANDGGNKGPYWTDPGTLLYTSPNLTLGQGGGFKLGLPRVAVPDRFTWTIEFVGFANTALDRAGLPYYDGVTRGRSYHDIWIKYPDGTWSLQDAARGFSGNFAVKVVAVVATNATPTITTNTILSGGQFRFQARVKPDRRYAIEAATGGVLGQWTRVGSAENITNGVLTWQADMDVPAKFLRVTELSPVVGFDDGAPSVTAKSVPGVSYMLQTRPNVTNGVWTALPGFVRTDSEYVTIRDTSPKTDGSRFYRILDANGK